MKLTWLVVLLVAAFSFSFAAVGLADDTKAKAPPPPSPPVSMILDWAGFKEATLLVRRDAVAADPEMGKRIWVADYMDARGIFTVYRISLFERGTLFGEGRTREEARIARLAKTGLLDANGFELASINVETREDGRKVFIGVADDFAKSGMLIAFTSLPHYDVLVEQVQPGKVIASPDRKPLRLGGPHAELREVMLKVEEYLEKTGK